MCITILILIFGLEAVRPPISTVAKVILATVGAGVQRLYALRSATDLFGKWR